MNTLQDQDHRESKKGFEKVRKSNLTNETIARIGCGRTGLISMSSESCRIDETAMDGLARKRSLVFKVLSKGLNYETAETRVRAYEW